MATEQPRVTNGATPAESALPDDHAMGALATPLPPPSEAGPSSDLNSSEILSPSTTSPRVSSEIIEPPTFISKPSLETHDDQEALVAALERARAEKEHLQLQYRGLLNKLTAMRNTLGEKLKEDAEELDRREATINALTSELASLQDTSERLREEAEASSADCQRLEAELVQARSQTDSSSSDVLSLTREMRELRGEIERLRAEREDVEAEASRERERREAAEDDLRAIERREREGRREWERAAIDLEAERERSRNLQDVLGEFQQAKDSELLQATAELEGQLKLAVGQLSEFKLRAANAETELSTLASDATRSSALEKELRDKNATISKLRHDAVVTNEHLTEALRRLRKNSSDNNVDRRLVTNILLSFLTTSRADSKRFEMLSLLSTILSWDNAERERAGLQRSGPSKGTGTSRAAASVDSRRRKSGVSGERTAEEEAAMNESFSNLFVEFLLKEASQGQTASPPSESSPGGVRSHTYSPPASGATTPLSRPRGMSSSSNASASTSYTSIDAVITSGRGGASNAGGSATVGLGIGRKPSFGLQEALGDRR